MFKIIFSYWLNSDLLAYKFVDILSEDVSTLALKFDNGILC